VGTGERGNEPGRRMPWVERSAECRSRIFWACRHSRERGALHGVRRTDCGEPRRVVALSTKLRTCSSALLHRVDPVGGLGSAWHNASPSRNGRPEADAGLSPGCLPADARRGTSVGPPAAMSWWRRNSGGGTEVRTAGLGMADSWSRLLLETHSVSAPGITTLRSSASDHEAVASAPRRSRS
jgi:hypothetical protein